MSKNLFYFIALLTLPLIRVLVFNTNYDEWLLSAHYTHGAAFVQALRGSSHFQAFIGGWVFPVFVLMAIIYWIMEEDKERIPMQFLLLPLAYIPISIVGFTLVNAEFRVSYLYENSLIILTFGYLYVMFWVALIALLARIKVIA